MTSSRNGEGKWRMWALAATLVGGSAHAQGGNVRATLGDLADSEAAPMPDVNAIERGEAAPASVSFGKLARKQSAAKVEGEPSAAATRETPASVSRSKVTAVAAPDAADEGVGEAFADEASAPPVDVPEAHQVQKGDTLWSLCARYFADPWKWPQLWALNPQVTNPHWIFAGDTVRLRAGHGTAGTVALDLPTAAPSQGRTGMVTLREVGFVSAEDLKGAARISGSREEKIMLATGDSAYLTFSKDERLVAGERYTVFTVDKKAPIIDPKNPQKVVGYLVRIHGDIHVNQISDDTTGRGQLVDTTDPIERGFLVSKRVQAFRRIRPLASEVSLEAKIIAAFSPTAMLAEQDFVVLSRGSKDGLKVGNRSYVIRKGDGYRPLMEGWDSFDDGYPKEVVAELLVVDVHDNAAVAWVARSTKEIRVGEFTETRRGY